MKRYFGILIFVLFSFVSLGQTEEQKMFVNSLDSLTQKGVDNFEDFETTYLSNIDDAQLVMDHLSWKAETIRNKMRDKTVILSTDEEQALQKEFDSYIVLIKLAQEKRKKLYEERKKERG